MLTARRAQGAISLTRRRRALLALALVVLILAGGAMVSAFAYVSVKDQARQLQTDLTFHLQAGLTELEAAKTSLTDANNKHDQTLIAQANVHFISAKVHFMVARQMADNSDLLRHLEVLPDLGSTARSQHVAVDAIADIGVAISDAGRELADLDAQLIKPATGGGHEGRTLLTVLNQTMSSLVKVRADLERARKAGTQVDISVLPAGQRASFVRARDSITAALDGIVEFERLVPILTELLGGNGARTYLIEQVNAAELRPGGGFIGTFSVVQADHGTLKLLRNGTGPDLSYPRPAPGQPGYVSPPGPFREWIPGTSWSFQDSNFYPDFPSSAQAAEGFAQPRLGRIDAVIAIDFYAVAKMLDLTGPLPVPGLPISVNSANLVPLLIEYDLTPPYSRHSLLQAAVAGPLMDRVATLPPDKWPALIAALNEMAGARHLQAYFNNADVQKEMDRVGWSGTVNPTGSKDYMMENESNLGGTKANYFVTRQFNLELTRKGALLHHKLVVDLWNDMPYQYRPNEYYSAYLRLYVSNSASAGSHNLRPSRYPNPAPPAGTMLIDGWVPLFHGYHHEALAVLEYDTPWQPDVKGDAQIYWQKQPGTVKDVVSVVWNDGAGHTYSVRGDLAQDRIVTLSPNGVTLTAGWAAQAQLPKLGLG